MADAGRWRVGGATVCLAGLLLAGCSGGSPDTDTDTASDRAAEKPDQRGPLAEFFGWNDADALGQEGEPTEQERQAHYQIQDHIVDCMRTAGFDYVPEPFPADEPSGPDPSDSPDLWALQQEDPEAFTRQYGYGITTVDPEDQLIPIDDLEPDQVEDAIDPSGDPNLEYRASLSEGARREYDRALVGYSWAEREAAIAAGEEISTDPAGCRHEAMVAVTESSPGDDDPPEWADLEDEWAALYQRIENDPRMVEAVHAWSGCMREAGYPGLDTLWAAEQQVLDRQAALYADWDPEEGPAAPAPADLERAREFELAIAGADLECRRVHQVDQIHREVQFDHEAQFIEDHREALEAYRDWLNELDQ